MPYVWVELYLDIRYKANWSFHFFERRILREEEWEVPWQNWSLLLGNENCMIWVNILWRFQRFFETFQENSLGSFVLLAFLETSFETFYGIPFEEFLKTFIRTLFGTFSGTSCGTFFGTFHKKFLRISIHWRNISETFCGTSRRSYRTFFGTFLETFLKTFLRTFI